MRCSPVAELLTSSLALGFFIFGCGPTPLTEGTRPLATQGTTIAPQSFNGRVLTCGSDQRGHKARYAVDYMTRKLQRFPELAAYSRLDSVSSCEEAERFASAYDDYFSKHVGFDDGALDDGPGGAAARKRILPRLKILGGEQAVEADSSPVVRIEWAHWKRNGTDTGLSEFCDAIDVGTGTFIAKNWILTAAHVLSPVYLKSAVDDPANAGSGLPQCLNRDGGPPVRDGIEPETALNGMGHYIIRWPANNAHPPMKSQGFYSKEITIWAYQYQHPGYKYNALENKASAQRLDLGLIYLPIADGSDLHLPADISKGWAVSIHRPTGDPTTNDQFYIAGYGVQDLSANDIVVDDAGVTDPDAGVIDDDAGLAVKFITERALYIAPAPGPDLTKPPIDSSLYLSWKPEIVTSTITTASGAKWNGSGVCHGDSGGPLFKKVQDSTTGTFRWDQYAVAYALVQTDYPPSESIGARCPVVPEFVADPDPNKDLNTAMYWTRLESDQEVVKNFFGSKFQLWPGQQSACRPDGNSWFCYGEPCGGPDKLSCPTGKSCKGSGETLAGVCDPDVCNDPFNPGSCDCVVGQCVEDQ